MPATRYDAIIIGGGANGLVARAVLAKAGRRVLHLVREQNVGGHGMIQLPEASFGVAVAPIEMEPDWITPDLIRQMRAPDLITRAQPIPMSVVLPDGGFLSLSSTLTDAAAAIRAHSPRDAERWEPFMMTLSKLTHFLQVPYQSPAPDLDSSSLAELPSMLSLGRAFRSLGKRNMSELLRVMPIPVQDLADDWFTFGPLKAAIGAAAVRDIRQGPRSGGTSYMLLHHMVGTSEGSIRGRPWHRSHGPNFIAQLEMAGSAQGVVTRANVDVARISVRDDAVAGVILADGEEISAPVVMTTEDPARVFLRMVDPAWLDPEFLLAVRNIKFRGSTAMVYFALEKIPDVPGLTDPSNALAGVISLSGTMDAIEKAYDASKYGRVSDELHIEISIPTLRPSDMAAAPRPILMARVRYTPRTLRDGEWDAARSAALGKAVTEAIARVIPRFTDIVRDRIVVTPRDIEERFGVTDGALTHGEMTLDQILFMRPVAGWGQYATPIRGLYLGGPGTHSGPGLLGMSGLLAARRMLADGRKRK